MIREHVQGTVRQAAEARAEAPAGAPANAPTTQPIEVASDAPVGPTAPAIGEPGPSVDAADQQFSGMSLIKALFDSTADHIHVKDLAGRYVLLNQADAGWFARPADEIIGRTDAELTDAAEAARAMERDRMVLESGNPLTYEQEAVRNGVTHTWLTTKNVVRDPAGRVAGLFTISHEITDERRQEAQLRQAAKMEAVGQLAGGIAHDFNNMLTAIRGYAELARASLPNAGAQALSDIDQIMIAADRAAELTHQLLAFSRRQVLATRLLDPDEMVGAIAPMLRRLLGENIVLTLRTAPGLGRICVDPAQLNQVILNLAVNARDAMPDGGRLLIETANAELDEAYVSAHPGAHAGSHVRLTVSDSGTGMDAAMLERIFEPFYTTRAAGTGLGLATVYGIVKQSDGGIDVYSEPGYGTTFNVYFQRVAGDLETVSGLPPVEAPTTGIETILLVEDESAVRGFALRALAAVGYTVIEASNGTDAIAAAAAHDGPIDLLLTDMIMPGMHGSELSSALTFVPAGTANAVRVGISGGLDRSQRAHRRGDRLPGQAVQRGRAWPGGAFRDRRLRVRSERSSSVQFAPRVPLGCARRRSPRSTTRTDRPRRRDMSKPLEIGVHLMTYGATWDEVVALAKEVDRLGYDFLLMHDHLLATQGDLHQPFFEAYTTLASFAHVTSTVKLGLMTGNNPLRNPGVVSKMVITLDHMSKGRMTLCLGAGSLPVEFPPHGLGNESVGQRLDAVDDALTIVRGLLAGEEVTLKSDHYDFDRVRHAPRPVQDRVPVIVGASGEKKGLRIVAKHADYWQMSVGPESADEYRHKNEVLVQHCESVGRDPGAIRRMPSGNFILRKHESEVAPALADMAKPFRWSPEVHAEMASTTWGGPSERVVEQLQPMKATGLDGLILMALPPFDYESIERFAREVRPALEA